MKPVTFVSTKTAAKEIDMKPRTIRQYCKDGKIKADLFGKIYLIRREVWEEWKARNITAAS